MSLYKRSKRETKDMGRTKAERRLAIDRETERKLTRGRFG